MLPASCRSLQVRNRNQNTTRPIDVVIIMGVKYSSDNIRLIVDIVDCAIGVGSLHYLVVAGLVAEVVVVKV